MKCYLGLKRECTVIKRILKELEELGFKDKRAEYLKKYVNVEEWIKFYCTFCIKAHAEKRRRKMSGRFGIGVTI